MTDNYLHKRLMEKIYGTPPKPVKKYYIPKKSQKRIIQEKLEKQREKDSELDKWFEFHMGHSKPVCAECGMEAYWLLKPQEDEEKAKAYKLIWRASQAHLLPKKKNCGFPSIAGNLDNHIVLFPSWGGLLCGCHGFYDSGWYNASTMKIWDEVLKTIKTKLYPLIAESEKKYLPEIIQKQLV